MFLSDHGARTMTMWHRHAAVGAILAAAVSLSACGDDGEDDTANSADATVEEEAAAPSEPAVEAGEVAVTGQEPAAGTDGAATVALAMSDLIGLWAEDADACAAEQTTTITSDFIVPGGGGAPCLITSTEAAGASIAVGLTCTAGEDAETEAWRITATGDARPATTIEIDLGGDVLALSRC